MTDTNFACIHRERADNCDVSVLHIMNERDAALLDPLVSGSSIARSLDVDPATVRRWKLEGMPSHEIGGLIRYRLSEVLAWRKQRVKPAKAVERLEVK